MRFVESPILRLESLIAPWATPLDYLDHDGRPWVCEDGLAKLFELQKADRICLFSSSRETPDTYQVRVHTGVLNILHEPVYTIIFSALGEWLEKQIDAGRPHIGVRIVK